MKLAMVSQGPDGRPVPAIVTKSNHVVFLHEWMAEAPPSIDAMVEDPSWLEKIQETHPESAPSQIRHSFDSVEWYAPVSLKRNVLCVGKNYREHIEEGARAGDPVQASLEVPIIFTKATTSLNHHRGTVTAWNVTEALDYEAELGVVLGRGGRHISPDNSEDYIFGYTLINDFTARDLQNRHRQWFMGKSLDTYCPMGPVIVTRDEIEWPVTLNLVLTVNGEVRQNLNTRDMVFDIPTVIASLSETMTLLPGDVLATGTGAGCGFGFSPPKFLRAGDEVIVRCDPIGELINIIEEESQ